MGNSLASFDCPECAHSIDGHRWSDRVKCTGCEEYIDFGRCTGCGSVIAKLLSTKEWTCLECKQANRTLIPVRYVSLGHFLGQYEDAGSPGLTATESQEVSEARRRAFELASQTCPLDISLGFSALPGGLSLFEDEFLVEVAKLKGQSGISSNRLAITTKRLIHTKGRLHSEQSAVYLTDIRDVHYFRPVIGLGKIAIEASGHHVAPITGMPQAYQFRDRLLRLVHWARGEGSSIAVDVRPAELSMDRALPTGTLPTLASDLREVAQLHQEGILTDDEFLAAKAKLLKGE